MLICFQIFYRIIKFAHMYSAQKVHRYSFVINNNILLTYYRLVTRIQESSIIYFMLQLHTLMIMYYAHIVR